MTTTCTPATATSNRISDHHLTAVGLAEVYSETDAHPLYSRSEWRVAVANEATSLGYWDWVKHAVDFAHDEASGEYTAEALIKKARRLRGRGYALVFFSPEELINVDASEFEERLVAHGNAILAELHG
jgi:hypothetical protein